MLMSSKIQKLRWVKFLGQTGKSINFFFKPIGKLFSFQTIEKSSFMKS